MCIKKQNFFNFIHRKCFKSSSMGNERATKKYRVVFEIFPKYIVFLTSSTHPPIHQSVHLSVNQSCIRPASQYNKFCGSKIENNVCKLKSKKLFRGKIIYKTERDSNQSQGTTKLVLLTGIKLFSLMRVKDLKI